MPDVRDAMQRIAEVLAPAAASAGLRETRVPGEIVFEDARLRIRLSWQPGSFITAPGVASDVLALECDRLPGESRSGPWIDLSIAIWGPGKDNDQWITGAADDFRAEMLFYLKQW